MAGRGTKRPFLLETNENPVPEQQTIQRRGLVSLFGDVPYPLPNLTVTLVMRRVSMETFWLWNQIGNRYGQGLGYKTKQEMCQLMMKCACKEQSALSEDIIRSRLRTRKYSASHSDSNESVDGDENHSSCSICLVDFEIEDEIGMLYYCRHEYHADCLKKWLRKKNLCPSCKALALVPPCYENWDGKDLRRHQLFFEYMLKQEAI